MDHEFHLPPLVNWDFFYVNTLDFVSSLNLLSFLSFFFCVSSLWLVCMLLVEVLLTAHVKESHTSFTVRLLFLLGLCTHCL